MNPRCILAGDLNPTSRTSAFADKPRTQNSVWHYQGIMPCIPSTIARHHYKIMTQDETYDIRKLTPRECYRLMDVDEHDIDKLLASDISNTRHYQLAGNSICVGVLAEIFRKMFVDKGAQRGDQLTFDF